MSSKTENNNFFIDLFENRLCEMTGSPYAVLTDSCSNAIFLSMKYRRLEAKNSKKLDVHQSIPRRTYLSVPMQMIHAGFKPNFTSIEWKSRYEIGNLNIYDCAVGLDRDMYNIKGSLMCLSFQQKKELAIGKGGAILTDSKVAYETIKRLSHDGRDSSVPVSEDRGITLGWHMNLTPDQAATGVMRLNSLGKKLHQGGSNDYPDISGLEVWT